MSSRAPHTRSLKNLSVALAVLLHALWAGLGCSNVGTTSSVSFSISVDEVTTEDLPATPPGNLSRLSIRPLAPDVSALGFSFTDVASIRVDVKETATGAPIYLNFDLVQSAGRWTGTLPYLPQGKQLTFSARATDANDVLLFSGSTDQALTTNNENVAIILVPANNGATITLPRVKRIFIPGEFAFNQGGNISFQVEGTSGETLSYSITPAATGGTFFPTSGTITLQSPSGTFVCRYVPPISVATTTVFTHHVKVTNAAGHSITTTFKTKVVPPDSSNDASGTTLSVLFNPVINGLSASRVPGTSNVTWQAGVADNDPVETLTYEWSFTPNGTFEPAPAFTTQTNPTTLRNYTTALQGTLTLKVTDSDNGKTTLNYVLSTNQFPDTPDEIGTGSSLNNLQAGLSHTCALFNDGTVRCWGRGNVGQLGYANTNSIGDTKHPYTVGTVPLLDAVVQLATGGSHTCALMKSGYVHCWGANASGQLGYGHTRNIGDDEAITTQSYVNLGGRAVRIAAGGSHTCALLTTGKVRCWGLNASGQLGYGHTQNVGDDEALWNVSDVQVGGTVQDIVVGGYHTCALLTTGKVRCWGLNSSNQLGYIHTNNIGDNEHPSTAGDISLGGTVLQVSAGEYHTCALLDTGGVRCWGYNNYGQLGYGHANNVAAPNIVSDVNLGSRALQIATGSNHTCALLSTGGIKCWGYNAYGQLGYAHTTLLSAPPSGLVGLGGTPAQSLSTSANHTCALLSTGKAICWGHNNYGQLGYAHTLNIGDDELPTTAGGILFQAP
jgi:alpha-tubulin suppressor-like RCC1 family protein